MSDVRNEISISKPGEGAVKGKGILGFTELFKTPNLRKKTLIIYYMWFSTSMVYYGLTLNSNSQDSLFINYSVGKGEESLPDLGSICVVTPSNQSWLSNVWYVVRFICSFGVSGHRHRAGPALHDWPPPRHPHPLHLLRPQPLGHHGHPLVSNSLSPQII